MLKNVKKCLKIVQESDESFHDYFIKYMMKIQDQNIDNEIRNQIRFNLIQLSHIDNLIEVDYRKLVNDTNVRIT